MAGQADCVIGLPELCYYIRPPEPPPETVMSYSEVFTFRNKAGNSNVRAAWKMYLSMCNITEPRVVPTLEPVTYSESTTITAAGNTSSGSTSLAGGLVALIVLLIALVIVAIIVIFFMWKHNKCRRFSIRKRDNSCLPWCLSPSKDSPVQMQEYGKNYFHNNLVKGEVYDPAKMDTKQTDAGEQCLSTGRKENQYTEPCYLDLTNSGSNQTNNARGLENKSFQPDDSTMTHSPGTDSNTPLFDSVDGPVLPHQILPADTQVNASSCQAEINPKPMTTSPATRKTSESELSGTNSKLRKKKKGLVSPSKHKSEPLHILEGSFLQTVETNGKNNRKSV